jgi:O-antigen ligase
MPEYIKALLVVLVIAAVVFRLAAPSLIDTTTTKRDYWRRAWVWVGATAAAFLARDYWVFALIAGMLIFIAGRKDPNPMAFFCLVMCAVPPLGSAISGFGVVNYLFDLNYLRLLSLVILLPAAASIASSSPARVPGSKLPDTLLAGYLVLIFILTTLVAPFTSALRQAFYLFIDVWLVYYVASRSIRDMAAFRELAGAFVLGATIMAVIAIAEAARGWLLYSTLESGLGVTWGYGNYMARESGGALRAMASTGHPIVMGYLMVVAIPMYLYLAPSIPSKVIRFLTLTVLLGALVATLSRGPWIGGMVMAVVVAGIGQGAAKRFGKIGLGVAVAGGVALLSDWGRGLIDQLPFIGTVGAETVNYRQQLFEVSMHILSYSPFFGSPGFYGSAAAQQLRQGEGIIDMVNSYLGIAMGTGVVGLSLFVGFFLAAAWVAWRARRLAYAEPHALEFSRAVLAAVAGMAVIIATTSSINVIPVIYYLFAGLAVGCGGAVLAGVQRAAGPATGTTFGHRSRAAGAR